MNHFLHLLILLPALFTTIIALPTFSDDTSNSWTDSVLDNTDTLLAGTFGVASPPYQPDTPANTPEKMQSPTLPDTLPPVSTQTQDQDWTKPMFLCCTNVVWWNDEETQCTISMEFSNWAQR